MELRSLLVFLSLSAIMLQNALSFSASCLSKPLLRRSMAAFSSRASILEIVNKPHSACEIVPDEWASLSESTISAALAACSAASKSAAWITVPISESSIIPTLSALNFKFHHTDPHQSHLYCWLKSSADKVPEYATHQVGVGTACIKGSKILCVREIRGNYSKWKLPGGLADLGESIPEAAAREVKEETGVDVEFKSMIGVRHTHNIQFGRSDLYFIVRAELVEGGNDVPVPEEDEISHAEWVDFEEFKRGVQSDGETPHPVMKLVCDIIDQGVEGDIQRSWISSIVPGRKPSPVYHAAVKK